MQKLLSRRLAVFAAVALAAPSEPAVNMLRGQGFWFLIAALGVGIPCAIAAQTSHLSNETTRETFGAAWALLFLGMAYNSQYGLNVTVPYDLRFIFVLFGLAIWSLWFGRISYAMIARETEEERARP